MDTRLLSRVASTFAVLMGIVAVLPVQANDWMSFNRTLDGQRFVPLSQINRGNVAQLATVCEADMGILGTFHTGPILVGNDLYVTTGYATVAFDPTNCRVRWKHLFQFDGPIMSNVNRGAAYLQGRLFRSSPHGVLFALDARSGKEVWRVKVADPAVGEYLPSAPIAWKGKVFIGIAGSDFGVKGRVLAFDARTGLEVWRFNTIPKEGDPGFETWKQPRIEHFGGAGTWASYTLDPKRGELFVPLGNPAPMYSPDARPGDNLYTNSFIVLDANSGKLNWYYQFTPNDSHDYDLAAPPIPYRDTKGRELVIVGSKDGYVYGIDRSSHLLAWRTPVTTIFNQAQQPTPEGVRACPGNVGGVQWNGPALDPARNVAYVGSADWCGIFTRGEPLYVAGQVYFGGGYRPAEPSENARGWVYALDASTGHPRWKFHAPAPVLAALTPTGGDLLFGGDMLGNFYAFDADTGKVLYTKKTGGSMTGGLLTYERGGRQFVTFTSGSMTPRGFSFDTEGKPKLVIMALGPLDRPTALVHVNAEPMIAASTMTVHGEAGPVARGRQVFGQLCSACHGGDGGGVSGPSLKAIFLRKDAGTVFAAIKTPKDPMPKLYPNVLNDADFGAVVEYIKMLK